MRWTPGGVSDDIEDRRDEGGGGGGFGGRGLGIGGILVLGVLSLVFRRDLITPFLGGSAPPVSAPNPTKTATEQPEVQFISFVLDDVQRTWTKLLPESGTTYRHATLVLFRDATESRCGGAQSATGPFYCPEDEKVYIDLGFFDELKARFHAPGEFAQAYVLAHEIGHHVQKILGIEQHVRQQMRADPGEQNVLSVRLELQADCLAGVWGHSAQDRKIVETGDVERGLAAAAAVGDDRIARAAGARVAPERFTHGSSQQRESWFRRGLERGTVAGCDTFVRR
jgi:predicted metalloprotease